jgi:hypothetical protein
MVLAGVYSPDRLRVIDSCRHLTGTVTSVTPEEDGDMHLHIRPDAAYRSLLGTNNSSEDGTLVTELMPRDHGHLPAPSVGDHVSMTGAYVYDEDHSWPELHPIWTLSINGGHTYVSGPQYGGSPPTASSANAVQRCRTNSEAPCVGYGESSPDTSGDTGTDKTPAVSSGQTSDKRMDGTRASLAEVTISRAYWIHAGGKSIGFVWKQDGTWLSTRASGRFYTREQAIEALLNHDDAQ